MREGDPKDAEWTDFQPVLDAETSLEKFKSARNLAAARARLKEQAKYEEQLKKLPVSLPAVRERS